MKKEQPDDLSFHSLTGRKAIRIFLTVPVLAVFVVLLLHHKGFINVEEYGLAENYLYYGGLAVLLGGLVAIFAVWRCPSCGSYLGKENSPAQCAHCGARFR